MPEIPGFRLQLNDPEEQDFTASELPHAAVPKI
jgi:hypothetical protein